MAASTMCGGGYLLTWPAGALDLEVFDSELARARGARAAGHLPEAAQALHSALGLWRGPRSATVSTAQR
jgi:hypothetical protein